MKKFTLILLTIFCGVTGLNAQSELWGVTTTGQGGYGTIYGLPTGSTGVATQFTFTGYPGASPQHTKLLLASNGKMYGMTLSGGSSNLGVLFEYDPSTNVYTKKVDFSASNGSSPRGALMQASNGKLYGMTSAGGANGLGVLFEFDPSTSTYTKKVDLTGTTGSAMGSQPFGTLVQAPNGKLYGFTRVGGANSVGVIFEYDITSSTYTKKFDMVSTSGSAPYGELTLASDGNLYGLASAGGTNNMGALFQYDYVNDVYTKKVDLSTTVGGGPQGSLMLASDGNLYGVTLFGGANNAGTIVQYSVSTSSLTKVADMASTTGATSSGMLVQAGNGKLYGLARTGGTSNQGTLFEFDITTSTLTKKVDLANTTTVGGSPFGSPILGSNGKLYGLTSQGGASSVGVIFEYDITGATYTKKIDLNSSNGANPNGHLVQASNGKLYGLTQSGGANSLGIIFEYDRTANTMTKKIDLASSTGSQPYGGMLLASNGKMYGLTSAGGSSGLGTLFEYDATSNVYTKKVDLTATNGSVPYGSLIQASNGKLYGLTKQGGVNNLGALFEYDITGNTYTKRVDLSAATGYSAFGSLVQASNGKLYGLTMLGGANSGGTLFEFDPSTNTFTKKVDLSSTGGIQPTGSLVEGQSGKLYGLTRAGGANGLGVIFEYVISTDTYTKKIDLTAANGSVPLGSMIKAADGTLYGVTSAGGSSSLGVLFAYDPVGSVYTKMFDFTGVNGSLPGYTDLMEVCTKPVTPSAVVTSTTSICQGNATTISASITAVSNATSYAWTLPSGATATSPTTALNVTANFAGIAAGTYTFGVQGVNVCGTGTASATSFTVNALPLVSVSGGTICNGGSFTLVPSGAASYVFSSGSNVVSPSATTAYSITGTSALGCASSNTAVATVTVSPLPVISVNSGTVCSGGSFTMVPTGASSYVFSSGSAVVSPAVNSTYSVTGTSAAGCPSSNTAIATVTVYALPVVSAAGGTICNGGSFTMSPSGAASYAYSGGSQVVSPVVNTTYSITGTSLQGCQSAAPAVITVTVYQRPTITANSGSICAGGTFTIVPSGAATYQYPNGGPVVSPNISVNYQVTGTSAQGCASSNTALASVTVNALPVITVPGGTVCSGSAFILNPSGASSYAYLNGGPVVTPTVTTTYSVSGTSAAGCTAAAPALATVTVSALPVISVSGGSVCAGDSFTFSASGAATYNYQGGSQVVTPGSTTTYTVSGLSAQGCASSNTPAVVVTVIPRPVISASGGTICAGENFTISPSGASSYVYSGGSNVVSPSSNTSYSVSGFNAQGCSSSSPAIVNVVVIPLPVVSISGPTAVCLGETATLTASGALSYNWAGPTSATLAVTPSTTTGYYVTGTDAYGCSAIASTTLSILPVPAIAVSNGTICAGGSFTIVPSGASSYTFSSGSNVVSPVVTTVYSVTGTSSLGCVSAVPAMATVSVVDILTVTVNGSQALCIGDSVNLVANGASTYSWSTGVLSPSIVSTPTVNTTFMVIGMSGPCSDTAFYPVVVNPLPAISVAATQQTICLGEEVTLTASGASSYTWGAQQGAVIVASPGVSTYFMVTGMDTNGCRSSAGTFITVNPCVGMSGVKAPGWKVFPNPSSGRFTVETPWAGELNVFDVTGKQVMRLESTGTAQTIDLTDHAKGLYILKATSAGETRIYRLVVD